MNPEELQPEELQASQTSFHSALLPFIEETLVDQIKERISESEYLSEPIISQMAREVYYDPSNLAAKAAAYEFINQSSDNIKHLSEFLESEQFYRRSEEFLYEAFSNPASLIEKMNIPDFRASQTWVYRFLNRHNFVFRKAHINKRGLINKEAVKKYLNDLAEAFVEYGPEGVINMDETYINVTNIPDSTIALKGQEEVLVFSNSTNEKEGFTAIGTISSEQSKF